MSLRSCFRCKPAAEAAASLQRTTLVMVAEKRSLAASTAGEPCSCTMRNTQSAVNYQNMSMALVTSGKQAPSCIKREQALQFACDQATKCHCPYDTTRNHQGRAFQGKAM